MSDPSFQDLWPRIQQGDESAFETVFRTHYADLCRFAHRYTRDTDQSEDLVQDVFFKVWKSASSIELRTAIKPYLYQSVRNACLNHIKHMNVRAAYADTHPAIEGEEDHSAEVNELEHRIDGAISKLPEKCREVFELSRFGGLKYQQIAEELGISVKTVENQMGRPSCFARRAVRLYAAVARWSDRGHLFDRSDRGRSSPGCHISEDVARRS